MLAKEPDEARRTGNSKVPERRALTAASRNMRMEGKQGHKALTAGEYFSGSSAVFFFYYKLSVGSCPVSSCPVSSVCALFFEMHLRLTRACVQGAEELKLSPLPESWARSTEWLTSHQPGDQRLPQAAAGMPWPGWGSAAAQAPVACAPNKDHDQHPTTQKDDSTHKFSLVGGQVALQPLCGLLDGALGSCSVALTQCLLLADLSQMSWSTAACTNNPRRCSPCCAWRRRSSQAHSSPRCVRSSSCPVPQTTALRAPFAPVCYVVRSGPTEHKTDVQSAPEKAAPARCVL